MPDAFEFREIGVFKCDAEYKHDIPRQGVFNQNRVGKIILNKGENFEQGLRGLEGFERIWIIFVLNRNSSWKPIVSPPVQTATQKRIGVFASRAPYRPNMIGLSCVKLLSVEGNVITVDESDILNDTPILDIKPYIPKADAFPEAAAGWVDEQVISKFKLIKSDLFEKQNQFLLLLFQLLRGPASVEAVQTSCSLQVFHFRHEHLMPTGSCCLFKRLFQLLDFVGELLCVTLDFLHCLPCNVLLQEISRPLQRL
jgi:tRNA-Thr(GGU) m(6)t(6)A37 methyltransferase TsaA